jgi:F-type H+-transporting ATPase subunit gamma
MSGTKEIKRRIKSIKNTKKITKAMELVAASKMRRSVAKTLASRPYARYAWEILQSLGKVSSKKSLPLLHVNESKKTLVIMIGSDRGLCGIYNAQITKKVIELIKKSPDEIEFISVGKKPEQALRRLNQKTVAGFVDILDDVSLSDALPIAKIAIDEYKLKNYGQVIVAYTDYKSALSQIPRLKQILPFVPDQLSTFLADIDPDLVKSWQGENVEYLFEPGYQAVLSFMAEKILRMELYQMFTESKASEESSRMLAMRNANEAAGEMIDDLTLVFNKARQAGITQEISEISAGTAVLQ